MGTIVLTIEGRLWGTGMQLAVGEMQKYHPVPQGELQVMGCVSACGADRFGVHRMQCFTEWILDARSVTCRAHGDCTQWRSSPWLDARGPSAHLYHAIHV